MSGTSPAPLASAAGAQKRPAGQDREEDVKRRRVDEEAAADDSQEEEELDDSQEEEDEEEEESGSEGVPPPKFLPRQRDDAPPAWWSDRSAPAFKAAEEKALAAYLARPEPDAGFGALRVTPLRYGNDSPSVASVWKAHEPSVTKLEWFVDTCEEFDDPDDVDGYTDMDVVEFDVEDAAGRAWPLTACVWYGDGGEAGSTFGDVRLRDTGALVATANGETQDGEITAVPAVCRRFSPHAADSRAMEQYREMTCKDPSTGDGGLQLAEICFAVCGPFQGQLGHANADDLPLGTYTDEQPADLRLKFASARVERGFGLAGLPLPRVLCDIVASYTPAVLPLL